VTEARGKWSYSASDGHVDFHEGFISVLDSNGEFDSNYLHPKVTLTSEPLEVWFGTTYLGSSEGVLYTKK
jgi:hypothetical protein